MKKWFALSIGMAFLPIFGLWMMGRMLEALDDALSEDDPDIDWWDWLGDDDYE